MQSNFIKNNQEKIFLFFGSLLILSAGFFSGYFYFQEQIDRQGIIIEDSNQDCKDLFNLGSVNNDTNLNSNANSSSQVKGEQNESENIILQNKTGMFVASKNSKIYHKPDCKYVKRIKEENTIWFQSAKEAEDRGYAPHDCAE
ncbi:MAG: hypothetical protein KAQ64_01820 [Candidatus Pacebacteria bacterium]|nr:hypothetical protein [Candidatus Paceibacterota bacterium]